ncbi:hypothetical protein EDB85DRAFT_2245097, partial [Lactarius pseudohatsudake]
SSSTPRASRTVIRKFHTLLKQQKSAQGDALANVNREIEELGGLHIIACPASGRAATGGGSGKVLIGWLKQMGWAAPVAKENEKERHRLLKVGAILPRDLDRRHGNRPAFTPSVHFNFFNHGREPPRGAEYHQCMHEVLSTDGITLFRKSDGQSKSLPFSAYDLFVFD